MDERKCVSVSSVVDTIVTQLNWVWVLSSLSLSLSLSLLEEEEEEKKKYGER